MQSVENASQFLKNDRLYGSLVSDLQKFWVFIHDV